MAKTEQDMLPDLLQELNKLQSLSGEVLENYGLNIKSRFTALISGLQKEAQADDGATASLSKKKIRHMFEELQSLKVKPERGRSKDLVRIEILLEVLETTLLPKK